MSSLRTARRSRWAVLILVGLATLLAAAGCSRLAKPQGWASPIDGGTALLISHRDKLYAVDPTNLGLAQLFPPQPNDAKIDPVALYGTPAVSDGSVFIPTHNDKIYAVNLESSQVEWEFKTDGSLIGSVLVANSIVYFGSDGGTLYALDEFGRPAWTDAAGVEKWFKTDRGIWSKPAIFEGVLYVTSLDSNLYAVDATSGDLLWKFGTDAGIASDPVVDEADGLVLFGGYDSKLHAIDINTHEEVWSVEGDNWFWTTPLLSNGVVYAGGLDKKVYAIDATTGAEVWASPFKVHSPVRAAPVMAGGVLFVADRNGNVFGIDPQTGEDAFSGPLALGEDVLADPLVRSTADGETILIISDSGNLYEINPATLRVVGNTIPIGG